MSSTDLATKMANASGWPLWHVGELNGTPAFLAELPVDPQQVFLAETITDWNKTAVEQAVRRAGYSAPSILFNPLAAPETSPVFLAFTPPTECIGRDQKPSILQLATLMECAEPKNALRSLFKQLVLPLSPAPLLTYLASDHWDRANPGATIVKQRQSQLEILRLTEPFTSYPTCAEMLADPKLPVETRETACRIIPALAYKPAPRIR